MITVRELNANDSEACIVLKKDRQVVEPLEVRKNSFFKIYDCLSNESFSFGAFFNEDLVGICTFIKLENNKNAFLVTDLVTAKKFENQKIFLKLFDYANQKIFSKIPHYRLVAIEERLNSLELLKFLVKDYSLKADEDQLIYSYLFKVKSFLDDEKIPNIEEASHWIDDRAQKVNIDGKSVVFFSDKNYRSYLIGNNVINRLFISGDINNGVSLVHLQKVAQVIMKARSLDYFVIISDKKLPCDADVVYTNRYLSFSKDFPESALYDFSKGILI